MTELELYISNTETLYPNATDYNDVVIRLYGRTRDGQAKRVTVTGFEPYFFAPADEQDSVVPSEVESLVRYEETDTLALRDRFAHLTPWREARKLVKVVAEIPGSVPELRDRFSKTWGADVIFTERFRIDKNIRTGAQIPVDDPTAGVFEVSHDEVEPVEMTDVQPRVVTLDIETDDRSNGFPDPGDARVLSIVAHDSYRDEYVGFLDLDNKTIESKFGVEGPPESLEDLGLTEIDQLKFCRDERGMFVKFARWFSNRDPDLVCGWNSGDDSTDGFDLPHIIERMAGLEADPTRLARESSVEVDPYEQVHIDGRSCYDLMDGWEDTKFTNTRSTRLNYVAEQALDDAKIEHSDMGYYEMYREDAALFLNYNGKDTRLTVDINEESGILSFKKRLKDIVGVDWGRTHQNNEFIEMAVRRKCREHGLAMVTVYDNEWVQQEIQSDNDEVNYEGAYVFSSFEGLRTNVVAIDLESLYPRTQQVLNVSPDTRIDKSKAIFNEVPFVEGDNGQAFRDDVDGIMRELIEEYMELKAKFKTERNEADPGTEEREKLAEVYNVTKTIVNSFYGYGGWNRSPLYNPNDAAAVTLTGQAVIKATAKYVNEKTSGEVVYGDTDSVYCQWPGDWGQIRTLEYVSDVCDCLNEEIYPALCEEYLIDPKDNRWKMEMEKLCDMFQDGNKKRYATVVRWTEGLDYNEVIVQNNEE
jgi:DNA polymerase I